MPEVFVICVGDLNARTGAEPDYIIDDDPTYVIDEASMYDVDSFNIPRVSKDTVVNAFGRSLMLLCNTFNVHMLNGRVGDDSNCGDFTCITATGASVVDYVLVSTGLYCKIVKFSIPIRLESDHLPLEFAMNTNRDPDMLNYQTLHENSITKYVWDPQKTEEFVDHAFSPNSQSCLENLIVDPIFPIEHFVRVLERF